MNTPKKSDTLTRSLKMSQNGEVNFMIKEKLAIMEALDHMFITSLYSKGKFYDSLINTNDVNNENQKIYTKKNNFKNGTTESNFDGASPNAVKNSKNSIKGKTLASPASENNIGGSQNALKTFGNRGDSKPKSYAEENGGEHHSSDYESSGSSTKDFSLKNPKSFNNGSQKRGTPKNNLNTDVRSPLPKSSGSSSKSISPCPSRKQLNVLCTYRENENRYWVMNSSDVNKLAEIQKTLVDKCDEFDSVYPEKDEIFGCTFEDEWFRGKIISVKPKVMVYFLDYGNTVEYGLDLVKILPEKLKSLPGLAYLVQFEDGTPAQYKSENLDSVNLLLEETKKSSDDVVFVNVIKGPYGCTIKSTTKTSKKDRSVFDTLTEKCTGKIFFTSKQGKNRFGAVVPDDNANAKYCWSELQKLNVKPNYSELKSKKLNDCSFIKANPADYVLVSPEENDLTDVPEVGKILRGKIICQLGFECFVTAIDFGHMLVTSRIFEMSENHKELLKLGGNITIEEVLQLDLLNATTVVGFQITGPQKSEKWSCDFINLTNQEKIGRGTIEKATEFGADQSKQTLNFPSGCTVTISAFNSVKRLYVRMIDPVVTKMFSTMSARIAVVAEKTKNLELPPRIGELFCVKSLKNNSYCRGKVIEVDGDEITVLFIDFGDVQKTSVKDMKLLPEFLRNIPHFTTKVHLKNVIRENETKPFTDYIKNIIKNGDELTMVYKEKIGDGVTLIEEASGLNIVDLIGSTTKDTNESSTKETIESTAKYTTETPLSKATTYLNSKSDFITDSDLNYAVLTPGAQVDLLLLHIQQSEFESTFSFWATDAGCRNVNYVFHKMLNEIHNYCNETQTPYRPREQEVCLAEFEGYWYRALIINSENDVFTVFFLDFGNTCELTSKSIRKILPKFIEPPVLALNCVVNDTERLKSDRELATKVFGILNERCNTTFAGVEIIELKNDMVSVFIPEIDVILKKC